MRAGHTWVRAAALLTLTLVASVAWGQEADFVEFPVTHEVGDVHEFTFTRSRIQTSPDQEPAEVSTQNRARLEVKERNDQGFILAWSTDWEEVASFLTTLSGDTDVAWLNDILDDVSNHTLLIQTDELSTPVGLVNADETVALFKRVVDGIFAHLDLPEESQEEAQAMLAQILSPEFIISRAMQDAQLVFMFTGGSFEVGAGYGYEDSLPNPLGGEPFPANIRFVVDHVDREAGTAHLAWKQETDGKSVRAFIEEFIRQAPNGDEALEEIRDVELGIFSNATYSMDLASGLPTRIDHERTIQFGPGGRIDRVKIERRSP